MPGWAVVTTHLVVRARIFSLTSCGRESAAHSAALQYAVSGSGLSATHLTWRAALRAAVEQSNVARKSVPRTDGHGSAIRATEFSSVETAIRDAEIRFVGFYQHAQHPPIDQDV